jgi:hypothetical protein
MQLDFPLWLRNTHNEDDDDYENPLNDIENLLDDEAAVAIVAGDETELNAIMSTTVIPASSRDPDCEKETKKQATTALTGDAGYRFEPPGMAKMIVWEATLKNQPSTSHQANYHGEGN